PIVGSDRPTRAAQEGARSSGPTSNARQDALSVETLDSTLDSIRSSLSRVGLFAEGLAASNNWVVSGKRTLTGKPLLPNSPHLDPSAPSIWYMSHLVSPELRAAGVTFPGVPGIVIGHNQRIAWGMTNLGGDVQDLYRESVDESGERYLSSGSWRPIEKRREIINVRKSLSDPSIEPVTLDVKLTSHGPIVFENASGNFALRWLALDAGISELTAFYSID